MTDNELNDREAALKTARALHDAALPIYGAHAIQLSRALLAMEKELNSARELLARALTVDGPLVWESIGWNAESADVLRLDLRDTAGHARLAFIPLAKVPLIVAAAKIAHAETPLAKGARARRPKRPA